MSQTIEELANEVRHITAKIPRVAPLPASVTVDKRSTRASDDEVVPFESKMVSRRAIAQTRLSRLEFSAQTMRFRMEKIEKQIADLRRDLEQLK